MFACLGSCWFAYKFSPMAINDRMPQFASSATSTDNEKLWNNVAMSSKKLLLFSSFRPCH
jgi:hypothetical protein